MPAACPGTLGNLHDVRWRKINTMIIKDASDAPRCEMEKDDVANEGCDDPSGRVLPHSVMLVI